MTLSRTNPTEGADYDAWAWLYDRTLGPAYRDRKMGFLDRALLSRLPAGARVLDLCCGTGQMMAPMLARGFAVTGLDELSAVFRAVHGALEEGGTFVFDINHPAQMTRHWKGEPAAGEIAADYAWMITPRYDPATAEGAFRVDMFQRPEGAKPPGTRLGRLLLSRPLARRMRLARLARFAADHPDWAHRSVDYPVHGHDLDYVRSRAEAAGFATRIETFSGKGTVDADSAACFVCVKRPAARGAAPQEAAE